MRKLVAGFTDPIRRPRYVLLTGVGIIVAIAVITGSLLGTSTRWFCNEVCHVIHYDNARQYYESSHANISCIACHIPPNLDGFRFAAEKAVKLTDVFEVIFGTYHLPLNPGSYLALAMPENQCTQCHRLDNRAITPSEGIIIDHTIHSEEDIACTICHNRVAHVQAFELELPDNEFSEEFMTMTACFRCHTISGESVSEFTATGTCSACHPRDFEFVPASHGEEDFFTPYADSSGHARMASAEESTNAEAAEQWEELVPELREKRPDVISRAMAIPHGEFLELPPVATVNECSTCHVLDTFCIRCHGYEMPHPPDFIEAHVELGDADPEGCAWCHNNTGDPALNDTACDQCHHPTGDPRDSWLSQHAAAAREADIREDCYSCHTEIFCATCHVRGEPSTRF